MPIKLFTLLSALFVSFFISSAAGEPYVGFDVAQRQLDMPVAFGKGLFQKRIPQYNLYAGFNFNEYIGIELGQLFTQDTTRTALTNEGELWFGLPIDPILEGYYVTENKIGMHGTHVNMVGQYPIPIPIVLGDLSFIGSIGVVSLKVKAQSRPIVSGIVGVFLPENTEKFTLNFYSRRVIPRFMMGLHYKIVKQLGIKIFGEYQTTSRFKNIPGIYPQSGDISSTRLSLKNNLLIGMGIIVPF